MRRIKLNNGGDFKCPICGNDLFIKDVLYDESDCGSREVADKYICFECGYVFLKDEKVLKQKQEFDNLFNPLLEAFDKAVKERTEKVSPFLTNKLELEEEIKQLSEEAKKSRSLC